MLRFLTAATVKVGSTPISRKRRKGRVGRFDGFFGILTCLLDFSQEQTHYYALKSLQPSRFVWLCIQIRAKHPSTFRPCFGHTCPEISWRLVSHVAWVDLRAMRKIRKGEAAAPIIVRY
jgi:hypothetical protein